MRIDPVVATVSALPLVGACFSPALAYNPSANGSSDGGSVFLYAGISYTEAESYTNVEVGVSVWMESGSWVAGSPNCQYDGCSDALNPAPDGSGGAVLAWVSADYACLSAVGWYHDAVQGYDQLIEINSFCSS